MIGSDDEEDGGPSVPDEQNVEQNEGNENAVVPDMSDDSDDGIDRREQ